MKKRGLMAIFLVATMLVSAMPAFAADLNDRQIVHSSAEMLESERSADGLVSVNAQAFGTVQENLFRVRLDVTTSENLREMTVKEGDAAVLIIVDKSTSMNHNGPIVQDANALTAVLAQYPQLGLAAADFPVTTSYDSQTDVLADVDALVNQALETAQANALAARLALEEEQRLLEEQKKLDEQKKLEEEQRLLEEQKKLEEENAAKQPPNTTQGAENNQQTTPGTTPGAENSQQTTPGTTQETEDNQQTTTNTTQGAENNQQTTPNTTPDVENSQQTETNGAQSDNTVETTEESNSISSDLLHQSSVEDGVSSNLLNQVRNCYHYRAWFERQAVIDFLDSYTAGITGDVSRYFALGTFHQDASIKADWSKLGSNWRTGDVGEAALDYGYNTEKWTGQTQTGSKLTYTSGSGTNVAGAYLLARNMMHVGFDPQVGYFREEGIDNLQVILITDGEPSCGLSSEYADPMNDLYYGFDVTLDNSGAISKYQLKGNAKIKGTHVPDDQLGPVFTELQEIAGAVAEDPLFHLTAVRYGDSSRESIFEGGGAGYCDSYQEVSDAALAQLVMSNIFQQTVPPVSTKVYPWTVTLPMGSFLNYEKEYTGDNSFSRNKSSFANNTLTWDLTRSQPLHTENTDTGSVYAYQYEFLARLDNTQDGFVAQQGYDVGGNTVLTYNVKTETAGSATFTEGSLGFEVPQVQGYLSELAFDKVDGNGSALAGATFTLTLDDTTAKTWTAQSDATGKVRFSVPSGHRFTLKETQAPAGYNGSNEIYNVNVSYGDLTMTQGASEITGLRVVNTAIPGYNPGPGGGGDGDGGGDGGGGTTIPDGDVPLGDNPGTLTSIPQEDVPLAELPQEEVMEIPEEEVPLAEAPKTGDFSGIWTLVSLVSGAGALWLLLGDKKRRDSAAQ